MAVSTDLQSAALGHSSGGDVAVEIRGVSKRYGDFTAVADVSMKIAQGEMVTLLGASGSGKTTTLSIVAGFTKPDSGAILVDGNDITRLAPHKRNLGFVFQNYALFPHMTVLENIAFPLKLRKMPKAQQTPMINDVLRVTRLQEFAKRYPSQLSGGQQQRVALARALVYKPPVLLMDEPFGALDRKLRREMQLELRQLHQDLGVTVLFVTHDQEEALTMSDRIALMDQGSVAQVDTPQAIYDHPLTQYVLQFVGDSNVLSGELSSKQQSGRCVFTTSGGDQIQAVAPADAANGTVAWAIRPERVRICSDGDSYDNRIKAMIEDSIFIGNAIRYQVKIQGDECLNVVDTNLGALRKPGPVTIGWQAEDGVVLTK